MPKQKPYLAIFDVSAADVSRVPLTDFGQVTAIMAAIRNVPGVLTVQVVPASEAPNSPTVKFEVHKHFEHTWGTLSPLIQRAVNRCCDPNTRGTAQSDHEIDGYYTEGWEPFAA